MDQVTVYPAVAVLEWMDVDETERQDRGTQYRIELLRNLPVEGDQAADEAGQVFRFRAHVVRDRLLGVSIPLSDKSSLGPQTEVHEARIADHDALQALQFVDVEWVPAGLTDCSAPALDAILRGAFAFDDVARLGVLEQQKRGGARHQIRWHRGGDFLSAGAQVHFDEAVQTIGARHQGAELGCPWEVVLDPMACGIIRSGSGELEFRVDDRRIGSPIGVPQVESPAGEPFVEEPDAPRVGAGRRCLDHRLDRRRADTSKQPLEHGEVEALMFQSESQVARQGRRGGRGAANRFASRLSTEIDAARP